MSHYPKQYKSFSTNLKSLLHILVHSMRTMLNFTPGPVTLLNNILEAEQPPPHRCNRFEDLYAKMNLRLLNYLNCDESKYRSIIIPGSGTIGIECLILSYSSKKNCLYLSNGSFGDRWSDIAHIYKENIHIYKRNTGDNLDYDEIENIIKEKNIESVFLVHHETSSCVLNDVAALNNVCIRHNVDIILDAVSTIAVTEIDLEKLSTVSFISFSSNKGLLSYPGISFIIGKIEKFEECQTYKNKSFYLDLNRYYDYSKINQTPTTPAVGVIQQTYKSMNNLPKFTKYIDLNKYIIEEMKKINISEVEVKDKFYFCTNFWYPKNLNEGDFFKYLEQEKIYIYKCKQGLKGKAFQVSNLGEVTKEDVDYMIKKLDEYFSTLTSD